MSRLAGLEEARSLGVLLKDFERLDRSTQFIRYNEVYASCGGANCETTFEYMQLTCPRDCDADFKSKSPRTLLDQDVACTFIVSTLASRDNAFVRQLRRVQWLGDARP